MNKIKFNHSPRRLRAEQMVLRVSPAVLDRAFQATNPAQYQHESYKIARLLEIPDTDYDGTPTRFRMPIIGASLGKIGFEDGRHRALLAKQHGLKVMPVAVRRDNLPEVRRVLSDYRGKARTQTTK
jgi:hypothetical protein